MIRFIAIVLFLCFFCIISWPLFLLVNIVGHFNPQKKVTMSQNIAVWGFKVVLKLSGTTLNVEGLDLVP